MTRTLLTITRTPVRPEFAALAFSVEMEMTKSREGRSMEIRDLPAEFLRGYTQHLSLENSHHDAMGGFRYQGTSAFTSRRNVRR